MNCHLCFDARVVSGRVPQSIAGLNSSRRRGDQASKGGGLGRTSGVCDSTHPPTLFANRLRLDSVHPKSPHYDLAHAKACVAAGSFKLGGRTGCIQHLEFHLHGETWRYSEFATEVFRAVAPTDFHDARRWPEPNGPVADEYGVSLPDEIVDEYGLTLRNWYLKFQMQRERKEDLVLVMSLHPLAFDMKRLGGVLKCNE